MGATKTSGITAERAREIVARATLAACDEVARRVNEATRGKRNGKPLTQQQRARSAMRACRLMHLFNLVARAFDDYAARRTVVEILNDGMTPEEIAALDAGRDAIRIRLAERLTRRTAKGGKR